MGRPATAATIILFACAMHSVAGADFTVVPVIQIGGHAETGGGVLHGSGLDPKEQGGGVAAAFALVSPVGARLHAGTVFELTAARADVDPQVYGVASIRTMARVELHGRRTADDNDRRGGFYALAGAGWNFNGVGTKITYLAGAPAGTLQDLHLDGGPAFELGGGLELVRKPGMEAIAEVNWVYDSARWHLQVSGEPERTGRSDLSGVTFLLGVRLHPWLVPRDSSAP